MANTLWGCNAMHRLLALGCVLLAIGSLLLPVAVYAQSASNEWIDSHTTGGIHQGKLHMRAVGASSITGEVLITEKSETGIANYLHGATPGTKYVTAVYAGRCETHSDTPSPAPFHFDKYNALDAQANDLGMVGGGADYFGPISVLADGNHYIVTYQKLNDIITHPVACGNIPAWAQVTSLPNAGGMPFADFASSLAALGLFGVLAGVVVSRRARLGNGVSG